MKNKILFAALAALMMLTLLGGCQLARPDDGTDAGRDTLCGVFITLDYLDISEPEITLDWEGEPQFFYPEARVYATRTEDENGFFDYTFEGIEGYRFFMVQTQNADGTIYHSSIVEAPMEDVLTQISDNGTMISGTIYFDVHCSDCVMFANPVYQMQDGRVYMVPGTGTGAEIMGEGINLTVTLSETTTQTTDGETNTKTMEVKITAQGLNTNQEVILKQMDENDQVVDETVITQDSIPETIRVLPDTAYMILEEHCIDVEGNTMVKRTLVDTSAEYFNVRFTGEHNIFIPSVVTLVH